MVTVAPGQNGLQFQPGNGAVFSPTEVSDLRYTAIFEEEFFVTASSIDGGGTEQDVDYDLSVGDATDNRYRVILVPTTGDPDELVGVSIVSVGGGSFTDGLWTFPVGRTGTLRVNHPRVPLEFNRPFTRQMDTPVRLFDAYVSGSLGANASNELWSRAAGEASSSMPLFSTQGPSFVWNVNSWVYDLDFTGVSPSNSHSTTRRAGVAVSPRHVLFASHYQPPVGTVLTFVTRDNQVVTRTVTALQAVAGGLSSDTAVGLLDSDLPESIAWYRLLPANVEDYLPTLRQYPVLPLVAMDQQNKAILKRWTGVFSSEWGTIGVLDSLVHTDLTEPIVTGDSGKPIFLVIAGEPVLVSLWTLPSAGPGFHRFRDQIDAIMTSQDGGYTTQTVDVTSFTDYS
jgi:hypothetical protein